MSAVATAANVAIAILVLTAAAAVPVGADHAAIRQSAQAESGVAPGVSTATGDVLTADALASELGAERTVLDDLLAVMLVEDRLYERLADLQFERVVHRSRMEERVSVQEAALGDLSREYYSMQHEPERLGDFIYEIRHSIRTIDSLANATTEQQAVVEELREHVEAENETLAELDTPLADALEAQRASQLRGLEYVSEQLAVQETALDRARALQQDRLEYAEDYQDIWREMETIERNRVLDRLEDEYAETHYSTTMQSSRFEGERYVSALLQEHHHARMETVVEYTSLLWSVEDDLAGLGEEPTPEAVAALQADLDEQAAELSAVRDLLATESAVVSQLREEMAIHGDVLADRQGVLWRQTALAVRLETQSRVDKQQRTVAALDRSVEEEAELLAALDEQLDAERRAVESLYATDAQMNGTDRLAAYLRVRDDVADLLLANLQLQEQLVDAQAADVVSKDRAVFRLDRARGVQDRWRQLPAFNDSLRLDRLDASVLDHRFEGQQEAFGLLSDLRREFDETFEGQQELLRSVRDDLDRIETASPPATGNESGALANESGAIANESPADVETVAADQNASDDAATDSGALANAAASAADATAADRAESVGEANASGPPGREAGGLVHAGLVLFLLLASAATIVWLIRVDYTRISRRDDFE